MKRSRRMFLMGAGAAGLSTMAGHGSGDALAAAGGTQYATLLELEKCIGCGACVQGCRERNGTRYPVVSRPMPELFPPGTKTEDWSQRQGVDDRLTPYNWLYIETVTVQKNGANLDLHIPRRCMHCTNPPCANLCPWGACSRDPQTGTVNISPSTCLGGAKCRTVCPWHVPQRQSGVGPYLHLMPRFAGNGVMYKCDRCADSYAGGQLPACIEVCPEQVQTIGPRAELLAHAQALAAERGHYLYGVAENGGTNTFYLSPVPFEDLAVAREAGPGRPTLADVPDSMAQAANLGRMLVAAPLAGIAAGMARSVKSGSAALDEKQAAAKPASLALPGWIKRVWVAVALILGFTGMMQMPIAARYGLTRLPGMGWTGNFYTTLNIHYVAGAVLIALCCLLIALRLKAGGGFPRFVFWGAVRASLVVGLVLTGIFRVLKNLPAFSFAPELVMGMDLAHLGLAAVLGALSLALWVSGRKAWTGPAR
ncbi:4Fe-4S dicluster domain-containing protein [Desulfovibrio falkowii]|uniref:Iron-sulfur cluster-binding protein n=1 Tax=Desulfovibrio desulfuricans (strain ATCC 27774 / DSM 6949 / MB) TaxID=525146 RepID=B8J4J7_DESDA|nr:4Fe-4S dicluster domain-containing protein [uncultured Desulfovibrio sp.]